MTIDILGTDKDGSFIANIRFEEKSFYAYYPSHLGNEVVLCEIPDLVTRFVVFYENDAKLHADCKKTLMREDLQVSDLFQKEYEDLFRRAMDSSVERKIRKRYISYIFHFLTFIVRHPFLHHMPPIHGIFPRLCQTID